MLKILGLERASGFPADGYNLVQERLSCYMDKQDDSWREFAGGWNAVAFRFKDCIDHSAEFTNLIAAFPSPGHPERYFQERELFGFFVSGLSTLESAAYAMYFIAVIAYPSRFNLQADLRKVEPCGIVKQLLSVQELSCEPLTMVLQSLIGDSKYKDWKDIRNILCHRAHPGRSCFAGGEFNGKTLWSKGVEINELTTLTRAQWLQGVVTKLIVSAADFCLSHLDCKS